MWRWHIIGCHAPALHLLTDECVVVTADAWKKRNEADCRSEEPRYRNVSSSVSLIVLSGQFSHVSPLWHEWDKPMTIPSSSFIMCFSSVECNQNFSWAWTWLVAIVTRFTRMLNYKQTKKVRLQLCGNSLCVCPFPVFHHDSASVHEGRPIKKWFPQFDWSAQRPQPHPTPLEARTPTMCPALVLYSSILVCIQHLLLKFFISRDINITYSH